MFDRAVRLESLFFVVALAACSRDPTRVFVPDTGFEQSVRIWTEQGDRAVVSVDEPLVLHAERRSGPWQQVERTALASDACWLGSAPPTYEHEVADNLRWHVAPAEGAFNTTLRPDSTREVRFSRPGLYEISAESAYPCGKARSLNVLAVEVRGR